MSGLMMLISIVLFCVTMVICYNRGLKRSKQNYHSNKLEFLALKWAVTNKFHDHLYGHRFVVVNDNNPLTHVLTTAKLDAVGHRWLAELSAYNFELAYKSGRTNIDAYALSRLPGKPMYLFDTLKCRLGIFWQKHFCWHFVLKVIWQSFFHKLNMLNLKKLFTKLKYEF